MNRELREILDNIKKYFYTEKDVISVICFGSLARNSEDYFSDLDLIFYIKNKYAEDKILTKLKSILEKLDYKILRNFKKYDKWIFYIYKRKIDFTTKIEFFISTKDRISNDVIYIIQSRVNNLKNAVLFDKENVYELLKDNWIDLSEKINELIEENINSFLYYYDQFLLNFIRGDIFRAYMNYTITFYKLGALYSLSYGEYRNLYQPWELTKTLIKNKKLVDEFYSASSDMQPLNMFYKKEKLVNLFFKALNMISWQFNIDIKKDKIKDFLKILEGKYYLFYNFRDVAKIINFFYGKEKIRYKKLYRSASLGRYDYDILRNFLEKEKIDLVLDLRIKEELELYSNRDKAYLKLDCICNEPFLLYHKDVYSYVETIRNNKDIIKKIFENYLTKLIDKSLIIHCEHGHDRTGIIVALILDLLCVEREYIIEDYQLSYGFTNKDKLLEMFNYIDENFENTEKFLIEYHKIDPESLKIIKSSLLVE